MKENKQILDSKSLKYLQRAQKKKKKNILKKKYIYI